MTALSLLERLFTLHKCASCRRILSQGEFHQALCHRCELEYRRATTESCPTCFRSAIECGCQPKMLTNAGSLCMKKLFFYHPDRQDTPQNKLVYFLKRNRNKRVSEFVAKELYGELCKEFSTLEIEDPERELALVNVPRGRKAVLEYGFDQAEVICKAISKESGIPYMPVIKRRYGGKEQKRLNAAQRKNNIKGLLRADEKYRSSIKGRYVILVDDVVTTGASMASCIPMLRKMAIKGVFCATLAFDVKKKRYI